MELYSETVQNEQGDIVNGATVTVYIASSGAVATIYDKDGVSQSNPFLSGLNRSKGEIEFAAVNGLYNIKVVNGASTVWHYNQSLFDATSAESPIWSGNGIYNGKITIQQKTAITTPTSAVNITYQIDMWKTYEVTVAANIQQVTDGFEAGLDSLKFTATSTATGKLGAIQKRNDVGILLGKEYTFSAWVKSNSTDARIIMYGVGVGSTQSSSAHTGGGAWELLSVTATLSASVTGIEAYIAIFDSNTNSVSITTADYIEFTDVRLDLGSHRLSGDREYGEEDKLCKRHFRKQAFYVPATTAQTLGIIDMRATPTITGGGTGFTSTGTTADTLIAYQTTGAVQTLELSAEL